MTESHREACFVEELRRDVRLGVRTEREALDHHQLWQRRAPRRRGFRVRLRERDVGARPSSEVRDEMVATANDLNHASASADGD